MQDADQFVEKLLVDRNARRLISKPIQGNYDIAHLKETHRYLFQDLPKAGLWNYNVQPGEFRVPTETWKKDRVLKSIQGADGKKPDVSFTTYSRMDSKAIKKLNTILAGANPENFKGLDKKSFTEKISKLYSDLDYLHPFREGNSRTLRAFTDQLSREAGYEINWEKFQGQENRDLLYIARDRGLAEHASLDEDQHPVLLANALYDMDRHRQYPGLAKLLEGTVEKVHGLQLAPRQDINKNQPQMHTDATGRIPENIQAMKQNQALAGKSPETLEKLAYWRGMLQEDLKHKPPSVQEAALSKFDREAENPAFLEKLEKAAPAREPEKERAEKTQNQRHNDDFEQSM